MEKLLFILFTILFSLTLHADDISLRFEQCLSYQTFLTTIQPKQASKEDSNGLEYTYLGKGNDSSEKGVFKVQDQLGNFYVLKYYDEAWSADFDVRALRLLDKDLTTEVLLSYELYDLKFAKVLDYSKGSNEVRLEYHEGIPLGKILRKEVFIANELYDFVRRRFKNILKNLNKYLLENYTYDEFHNISPELSFAVDSDPAFMNIYLEWSLNRIPFSLHEDNLILDKDLNFVIIDPY